MEKDFSRKGAKAQSKSRVIFFLCAFAPLRERNSLLLLTAARSSAQRFDKALGLGRHSLRKLNRRIGGEPVNAATCFGEIKGPYLFRCKCIFRRPRSNYKNASTINFTYEVVDYPATGRNHLVDDHPSQVSDSNSAEHLLLFARSQERWIRAA